MNWKYFLDKSSNKINCPQCQKKTFVRYINKENGQYLGGEFGRCDREQKCKYFKTPKGVKKDSFDFTYTPPPPTSYHPNKLVERSWRHYKENDFVTFLISKFGKESKELISKYFIGTSSKWKGATIFWQVDHENKVRHGKIMLYDEVTGKRRKNTDGKAYISSVRSVLKLKGFNLKQCLFGLHLVNESKSNIIGLVESEKTAILMNHLMPEYIWMATGSKSGFKYEMLKPIVKYKIVAYPDKGEYHNWTDRAMNLNDVGFDIEVSDTLEGLSFKDGSDIADVYLSLLKDTKDTATPIKRKVNKENAPLRVVRIKSAVEVEVNKMIEKSPVFANLIESLDLNMKESVCNDISDEVISSTIKESLQVDNWNKEIQEVEMFLTSTDKYPKYVKTQLSYVKHNNGNPTYKPYLDRLMSYISTI